MPKISASNIKGLLINYAVRIVLTTVLSVLVQSLLFSFIVLQFDIDLELLKYFGVIITILSSIIISYVSTIGFKNNVLLLSIISVIPLLLISIINFAVNNGSTTAILIKILGIILCSILVSVIKVSKKLRWRYGRRIIFDCGIKAWA